jgi:hypothetical protein
MPSTQDDPKVVSATKARAGRIVKGGAIRRVLLISLALAVGAMLLVYLLF